MLECKGLQREIANLLFWFCCTITWQWVWNHFLIYRSVFRNNFKHPTETQSDFHSCIYMRWRDLLLKLKIILKFSLVRHAQRQRLLENEIKPALLYVQQSRMISLLNTSCYDNKKFESGGLQNWSINLISKLPLNTLK